jgi:hypothetical protein
MALRRCASGSEDFHPDRCTRRRYLSSLAGLSATSSSTANVLVDGAELRGGQGTVLAGLARRLTQYISQPVEADPASANRNDNTSDLFIQIISNLSVTGGSSLFAGINTTFASHDKGHSQPDAISASVPSPAEARSAADGVATELQAQFADMLQSNYIDLFETSIEEPYDGTCSWLLHHELYDRWWNDSDASSCGCVDHRDVERSLSHPLFCVTRGQLSKFRTPLATFSFHGNTTRQHLRWISFRHLCVN